jgi:hypothetical protein
MFTGGIHATSMHADVSAGRRALTMQVISGGAGQGANVGIAVGAAVGNEVGTGVGENVAVQHVCMLASEVGWPCGQQAVRKKSQQSPG